jgi:hypothetical protein
MTTITKNQLVTSVNNVHRAVVDFTKRAVPIPKWRIRALQFFKTSIFLICTTLAMGFGVWFFVRVQENMPLLQPSLFDISGIFWIWNIELFATAFLFWIFALALQKVLDNNILLQRVIFGVPIFTVICSIFLFTPTAQALQVSNLSTNWDKTLYRKFQLNRHIQKLAEKNTFYGLVTSAQNNTLHIDHGGIELDFQYGIQTMKPGDIVSVQYTINQTNQRVVTNITILK